MGLERPIDSLSMTIDFHPIHSYPDLSTEELARKFGITVERVRLVRRGTIYKREEGDPYYEESKWAEWVADCLSEMGIDNEILPDLQIKLLRDNAIVWVGVGSPTKPPSHLGLPVVSLRRSRGFNKSDWIIAINRETETVFVIPTKVIPASNSENNSFRIQEEYAHYCKYAQYSEAWYLLME